MCADHDEVASCDFLLATRIQYESRRQGVRTTLAAPTPVTAPDTVVDAEQEAQRLRAAEFLVATRELREATQRAGQNAFERSHGDTRD